MTKITELHFTDNTGANRLLAENPLALLIGMLLDQQVTMEMAFRSPERLQTRLGGNLDARRIAETDPEALDAIFREQPALHRYPANMAKRTQTLCEFIVERYGGDTAQIWTSAADGKDLYKRLRELPGFGDAKARVFVGVLGKRLGVAPAGWKSEAADWASIADVAEFEDIQVIREAKRAAKAKAKAK